MFGINETSKQIAWLWTAQLPWSASLFCFTSTVLYPAQMQVQNVSGWQQSKQSIISAACFVCQPREIRKEDWLWQIKAMAQIVQYSVLPPGAAKLNWKYPDPSTAIPFSNSEEQSNITCKKSIWLRGHYYINQTNKTAIWTIPWPIIYLIVFVWLPLHHLLNKTK